MGDDEAVFVETAGRLHFGVLDLRGARGRWFGGIGAAAPEPTLLLSATRCPSLEVSGADAERARGFAARCVAHFGIPGGVRLRVHRAIPPHSGLGSGTQLALAVGRAIADVYAVEADVRELARAVGRARRSAVGTWTFAGGGLVVEGGRRAERDECGPLIARVPFPPSWRCVVAVPDAAAPGLSGAQEEAAFASLPAPSERDVEQVAHLVLLELLPALADADLAGFGRALTDVQRITGRWFATVQGGVYARGASETLVRCMSAWGAPGVGQSSWGPAVYGIVDGEDAGRALAERLRATLGGAGQVYEGAFRETGAQTWRASITNP